MVGPVRPAGYDLVVATDQLPIRDTDALNAVRWRDSAGSAWAALRPVVAAQGGAWFGGSGGPAGQETALDGVWMHPVTLDGTEADQHREHCANTLAPLYHDWAETPRFSQRWHDAYEAVNRAFAVAIAGAAAPEALVWVHDHHLQLVPGLLRRLRPDLRIGFFLHSPFPPVERYLRLPARTRVLHGLLGADVIGFQQARSARNFLDLVGSLARLPTGDNFVAAAGRRVAVEVFPSSVDVAEVERLASDPAVRTRAEDIRAGLPNGGTVLLAVGSFEAADGVERMLDVYAELLGEGRLASSEVVLVYVALPGGYGAVQQQRRERVDRRVAQINGLHAMVGHPPIHYLHRELDRAELIALYLAADVMLATPLHAGMALTAKEFVAARLDNTGSLVLSEFSGAADLLSEAIVVNPHADSVKSAVLTAVKHARRDHLAMRVMRERLRRHDATAWARGFLSALSQHDPPTLVEHEQPSPVPSA